MKDMFWNAFLYKDAIRILEKTMQILIICQQKIEKNLLKWLWKIQMISIERKHGKN